MKGNAISKETLNSSRMVTQNFFSSISQQVYHNSETAHAKVSNSWKKGSVTNVYIRFIIQFLHS